MQDEDQDALEKMDEEEDDDEGEIPADPKKLKKKGFVIEGEEELLDADGTPIIAPDPFAPHIEGEEDEEDLDIDEEFADKEEW